MAKPFSGFMKFVREQGVVGLAVGLTLGTAVTVFVKSIVDNMVNPVIGMILPGNSGLQNKFICLDHNLGGDCTNKLSWGATLSALISFLTIALVVYLVVHGLRLDKLDIKEEKKK